MWENLQHKPRNSQKVNGWSAQENQANEQQSQKQRQWNEMAINLSQNAPSEDEGAGRVAAEG